MRTKAKANARRTRWPIEILTPDEVRALMNACGDTPIGIRHRALIAVMFLACPPLPFNTRIAPRTGQACVSAKRSICMQRMSTWKTVGIDPAGADLVRLWIDQRTTFDFDWRHPLLCSRQGNRLTDGYVRRLMPRLGQIAGIAKRVHAHGLRHTHAAELRSEGVDIGIISKQLGHRSIATTARYLDHIAPYAVVEAMSGRAWS